MKFAYFGSFPPQYYGLRAEPIDLDGLQVVTPPPGLYVVSAHIVARAPEPGQDAGQWLRRMKPTAIIGHCLYVFDVK